jgi:glycosyltransferase involved in cell wall biosynthesis
MGPGLVSVVVPAYGQARFLGEAVESVLNQTYRNVEVVIVNDASPDETDAVALSFTDRRVRYVRHDRNMGLPAARNSGIQASTGHLVALLDADDTFHPDKIGAHVALFERDPGIGAAYNGRFELNHSALTVREIWRPPATVGLEDFVRGFPFAPSETVVRREWLMRVGLFDPAMGSAEDTDLPCRLALAGCRFSRVDRALNYRRYHSRRGRKNLPGRLADVRRAIDAVFADPRCPDGVRAIGSAALSHHLMVLVSLALMQEETRNAHDFLRQLVEVDPSCTEGDPCPLVSFLMMESVANDSVDHEQMLERMLAQFPASLGRLSGQHEWAVGRGYLWKGLRAALWERLDDGRRWIDRARESRAAIDEEFVQFVTSHLLDYEHEYGRETTLAALDRVASCLERLGPRRAAGWISGSYMFNRAFAAYHGGRVAEVPSLVMRGVVRAPAYLANRGVLKMLARSVAQSIVSSRNAAE